MAQGTVWLCREAMPKSASAISALPPVDPGHREGGIKDEAWLLKASRHIIV